MGSRHSRSTGSRPRDHGLSKQCAKFRKWSEAAKARTAGLSIQARSLGNLRAMHQPVAAGKVIALNFNDAEKAVDIGAYIADDDAWQKVLSGIFTGFSVGGSYAKRWADPQNPSLIRYTADPVEISLVDSPAVPTATFTLVKGDGSSELRKVGQPLGIPMAEDVNPAEALSFAGADQNPFAPEVQPVRAGLEVKDIPGFGAFLSPQLVTYRGTDWTDDPYPDPLTGPIYKALAAVQALIDVDDAVEKFNNGVYREYMVRDQHLIARQLVFQARDLGLTAGYDPVLVKIDIEGESVMNKVDLMGLVDQLRAAIQTGVDQIGSDPDAARAMLLRLVDMLSTASDVRNVSGGTSTSTASSRASTGYSSGSSPSSYSTPSAPSSVPPTAGGTARRGSGSPTPTPGSGPTSPGEPAVKVLSDKVDRLTDAVSKLAERAQFEKIAGPPVNNLSSLIKSATSDASDLDRQVLSKLLSGDPHALQKAAQVAGSTQEPDATYVADLAMKTAFETLADSGAFSALYKRYLP
jgi:hypothetical protein